MFRFTIRDVLWLTVVVGLAVGWFVNRQALQRRAVTAEVDATDFWRSAISNSRRAELLKKYDPDPSQDSD